MAVTDARQGKAEWTGTTSTGVAQYSVTWKVVTDDKNDGPQVVAAGVPVAINASYSQGNDSDPTSLLLRKLPRRVSDFNWTVRLEYGDPEKSDENTKPDGDGNQTTDPLQWRDEYRQSQNFREQVVGEDAWNVNAIGAGGWRPEDTQGGIQNSQGDLIKPSPTKESVIKVWNLRIYQDNYPENLWQPYRLAINDGDVTFQAPGNHTAPGPDPKHTWQCQSVTGAFERINNVDVWVIDFVWAYNPQTWNLLIEDIGLLARAADGDPDLQKGGSIATGDKLPGRANKQNQRDFHGDPVLEEMGFNGLGQELGPNDFPVFLPYRVHPERDFLNPGLLWPFI